MKNFLPISKTDMEERGWDELDFVFVSGDAYVDHPSFGPAILSRLLEAHGYRVGVIAQPDWRTPKDFRRLGCPKLAFLVSAGNMDSMLNKLTAAKKRRSHDAYSPGGRIGCRPDRATVVYAHRLRESYPDAPIIIGGIEASLRRFAHYDYWSDSVRRSILVDSMADLLIYGMGERAMLEIAAELHRGIGVQCIQDVKGTCYRVPDFDYAYGYTKLPSFQEVREDRRAFADAFRTAYLEQDPIRGKRLAQQNGEWCVVANPPAMPLSQEEMDEIYDLPYRRSWHPCYDAAGGVPALQEVRFSITSHRGCFGECSFCAIVSHAGRIIQRRSDASILREAEIISRLPDFKGCIHDVGGPTANFHRPACNLQLQRGACKGKSCLSPAPCRQLVADQREYMALLRKLRALPGIRKVFIRSGIRYDYLLLARDGFLEELCRHHVSGQLKVAPEHAVARVTRFMGKPPIETYLRFAREFRKTNERLGKKQYLVPYFMSSHPGATLSDAVALAEFIRDLGHRPEQVQDFIPTPGTLATCMYCTGTHPLTGEPVFTARSPEEKRMQRCLMQYWKPQNRDIVRKALRLAGREDLIGHGPRCLVPPEEGERKSLPSRPRGRQRERRK